MIRPLFEWLSETSNSIALREAFNVYPWLLTSHVISTSWFAGLILMMDLRLAGIGNLSTPLVQIQKRLFPWQMITMVISFATGGFLFYGDPMRFYPNFWFWLKALLMLLAASKNSKPSWLMPDRGSLGIFLVSYRTKRGWLVSLALCSGQPSLSLDA